MNTLKAFVNIQPLTENAEYVNSNIGELSSLGYTYARDKQSYSTSAIPDLAEYELVSFLSKDASGVFKEFDLGEVTGVLKILHELRIVLNAYSNITRSAVFNYMYSVPDLKLTNLDYSSVETAGGVSMPGWLGFVYNNDISVNLWVADTLFRRDYDEYSILVIPPTLALDELADAPNLVIEKLVNADLPGFVDRVNVAKGEFPETVLKILQFDYVNPLNPTQKVKSNWGYVIYGIAGDYINTLKNATIEYIQENSTRSLSYWETLFPEIFKRNEFILLPRWSQIAIPDMLTSVGIYSQVSKHGSLDMVVEDYLPEYTAQHINANTYIVPFSYRYLLVNVVNGEHNESDVSDFKALYPDFVPITPTSPDFNRMNAKTQQMVIAVEALLREADIYEDHTASSTAIRKVYKNGVEFLSSQVGRISFLALPKKEFV